MGEQPAAPPGPRQKSTVPPLENGRAHAPPREPTFIVGLPRTGSKIYMNVLNAYSEINVAPEIFFLTPGWIRADFERVMSREGVDARTEQGLAAIVDQVFDGRHFAHNWDTRNGVQGVTMTLPMTSRSRIRRRPSAA